MKKPSEAQMRALREAKTKGAYLSRRVNPAENCCRNGWLTRNGLWMRIPRYIITDAGRAILAAMEESK